MLFQKFLQCKIWISIFPNSRVLFLRELIRFKSFLAEISQPLSPISIVARPCCALACPCQTKQKTMIPWQPTPSKTNSLPLKIGRIFKSKCHGQTISCRLDANGQFIQPTNWDWRKPIVLTEYLLYQLVQDCIHSRIHRKGVNFSWLLKMRQVCELWKPTSSGSRHFWNLWHFLGCNMLFKSSGFSISAKTNGLSISSPNTQINLCIFSTSARLFHFTQAFPYILEMSIHHDSSHFTSVVDWS